MVRARRSLAFLLLASSALPLVIVAQTVKLSAPLPPTIVGFTRSFVLTGECQVLTLALPNVVQLLMP